MGEVIMNNKPKNQKTNKRNIVKRFIFAFTFAVAYAYKNEQWKRFDEYMKSKGLK